MAGVDGRSVICSMCGDEGFLAALLLCKTCGHRHQHMYCSRFYPNVDVEKWSCEWCIHEEEQRSIKRQRVFDSLLDIAESMPDSPSTPPPPPPSQQPEMNQSSPRGQVTREKKKAESETKNGGGSGGGGGGKALARWKSLAARGKFGGRRYKLLADVLC